MHINDAQPNMGDSVFISDGQYWYKAVLQTVEDCEDDEFKDGDTDNEYCWYDEDNEQYCSLENYPFWSSFDIEVPLRKNLTFGVMIKKENADFTIPGYKIVGGRVVKA